MAGAGLQSWAQLEQQSESLVAGVSTTCQLPPVDRLLLPCVPALLGDFRLASRFPPVLTLFLQRTFHRWVQAGRDQFPSIQRGLAQLEELSRQLKVRFRCVGAAQ